MILTEYISQIEIHKDFIKYLQKVDRLGNVKKEMEEEMENMTVGFLVNITCYSFFLFITVILVIVLVVFLAIE